MSSEHGESLFRDSPNGLATLHNMVYAPTHAGSLNGTLEIRPKSAGRKRVTVALPLTHLIFIEEF